MNDLKPVIKVIGVGGGGCNAISFMSYSEINDVEFIAANTDAQDLEKLKNVESKIQLGHKLTGGRGAGADPTVGRKSAEENEEMIRTYLEGTHLLFISAGMGGGTGTGAAPVIAKIAKDLGILVIAVVTKPFSLERESRMNKAVRGIEELKDIVDSLIVIPNEKLKEFIDPNTPITEVFSTVDKILHNSIQGISDIITKPGLINIDFNDLKTIVSKSGNSMIGLGVAKGDDKARKAALEAISCPLLEEKNLLAAKRVIVNVTLGADGSLKDVDDVGEVIKSITAKGAEVIMGTSIDEKATDQTKVTIIAADFLSNKECEEIKSKEIIERQVSTQQTQEQTIVPKNKDLPRFFEKKNVAKVKTKVAPPITTDDEPSFKDFTKPSSKIEPSMTINEVASEQGDRLNETNKIEPVIETKVEEDQYLNIPNFLQKKI